MKLWKKVYLVTLTLMILCVNLGIYGLFHITYKQMLQAERKHCMTEFSMLQKSFSENVKELEQSVYLDEKRFCAFLSAYGNYYNDNDFSLTGWHCKVLLHPNNQKEKWTEEHVQSFGQVVNIDNKDGHTILSVSDCLDSSHGFYRIGLQKKLTDFDETWSRLVPVYIGGSLLLSVGLSLLLGIVVRRLLKPVDMLTDAVNDIRSGNLSRRVRLAGNDELSKLGGKINEMAAALEENVALMQEEATQKQQLIDNLAHEMNTPITSIQGFTRYLQIGNVKEEEKAECLEFIDTETNRLKGISTTILNMAKLRNNEVEMQKFSLKEMCERIYQLEKPACEEQQVNLSMECEIDLFVGNEVLLESLLRNFIHNSMHATSPKGSISVVVKEEFSVDPANENIENKCFLLSVSDTGSGIPKEAVPHIFDLFFRVDKSRSRALGGSGLGLAFCKTIVELHHGTIKVDTEEGVGTTFTVKLPENFNV